MRPLPIDVSILLALLLLLILLAVVVRGFGGSGPLNDSERRYVSLVAIPFLLAIVVPAAIRHAGGQAPGLKRWVDLASGVGLIVSAMMGLWGISLILGARRRHRAWGWPLGVAVLIASGPALVVYCTTWLIKLMD